MLILYVLISNNELQSKYYLSFEKYNRKFRKLSYNIKKLLKINKNISLKKDRT